MAAITSAELDGKPLLGVLLTHEDPEQVVLLPGIARATDATLELVDTSGNLLIRLPAGTLAYNCFRAKVLPKLTPSSRYRPRLAGLAKEFEWCAGALSHTVPEMSEAMPGLLGGLAVGPQGQIYLVQVAD